MKTAVTQADGTTHKVVGTVRATVRDDGGHAAANRGIRRSTVKVVDYDEPTHRGKQMRRIMLSTREVTQPWPPHWRNAMGDTLHARKTQCGHAKK